MHMSTATAHCFQVVAFVCTAFNRLTRLTGVPRTIARFCFGTHVQPIPPQDGEGAQCCWAAPTYWALMIWGYSHGLNGYLRHNTQGFGLGENEPGQLSLEWVEGANLHAIRHNLDRMDYIDAVALLLQDDGRKKPPWKARGDPAMLMLVKSLVDYLRLVLNRLSVVNPDWNTVVCVLDIMHVMGRDLSDAFMEAEARPLLMQFVEIRTRTPTVDYDPDCIEHATKAYNAIVNERLAADQARADGVRSLIKVQTCAVLPHMGLRALQGLPLTVKALSVKMLNLSTATQGHGVHPWGAGEIAEMATDIYRLVIQATVATNPPLQDAYIFVAASRVAMLLPDAFGYTTWTVGQGAERHGQALLGVLAVLARASPLWVVRAGGVACVLDLSIADPEAMHVVKKLMCVVLGEVYADGHARELLTDGMREAIRAFLTAEDGFKPGSAPGAPGEGPPPDGAE
jgi:hypothetical protein